MARKTLGNKIEHYGYVEDFVHYAQYSWQHMTPA